MNDRRPRRQAWGLIIERPGEAARYVVGSLVAGERYTTGDEAHALRCYTRRNAVAIARAECDYPAGHCRIVPMWA